MRLYARFGADGLRPAFYPDDVYPDVVAYGPRPEASEADPDPVAPEISRTRHPAIPADAVEISYDQWQDFLAHQGERRWDGGALVAYSPTPPPATPPASVSLAEWRSALDLWMIDGASGAASKLSQVYAKVTPIRDAGNPLGKVAMQQLEYSNNVELSALFKIKDAFGFDEAACIESMWRADRVRSGDFSGVWPIPAGA